LPPKDLPFPACPRPPELPGFALSYAFETSKNAKLEGIKQAFSEFRTALWKDSMVASI
jgi:hypothetical protein